jgi:uncharacterized membrane protein
MKEEEEESNQEKYYRLVFGVMGMLLILCMLFAIIDVWIRIVTK